MPLLATFSDLFLIATRSEFIFLFLINITLKKPISELGLLIVCVFHWVEVLNSALDPLFVSTRCSLCSTECCCFSVNELRLQSWTVWLAFESVITGEWWCVGEVCRSSGEPRRFPFQVPAEIRLSSDYGCSDLELKQREKMFKSARWRSERSKIKAVFKLQFHATQVILSNLKIKIINFIFCRSQNFVLFASVWLARKCKKRKWNELNFTGISKQKQQSKKENPNSVSFEFCE